MPIFRYLPPLASATQSTLSVASSPWSRSPTSLVFQVVRVEKLLLRPLDLLTRPHDLDQLFPSFRRADHDRADEMVVLEKELAVELFFKAVCAHRLEAGLHVGRHA